jgi:hypothetical protein
MERGQDDGAVRVGWKEYVDLPDLGVLGVKAKMDTGARSSSLHCSSVEVRGDTVRLVVPPDRRGDGEPVVAEAALAGWTVVRSSNAGEEHRPVIETTLVLGSERRSIRLTLTDRTGMLFRLLLGRTALAGVTVDPEARYLTRRGRGSR